MKLKLENAKIGGSQKMLSEEDVLNIEEYYLTTQLAKKCGPIISGDVQYFKYLLKNILYKDNIVEDCVYSIEYFLEKNKADDDSRIENCEICNNLLRRSGYGWGQQRHNVDTPAHIKGWSYDNTAQSFSIHHNIFDRAAYRMIHTV